MNIKAPTYDFLEKPASLSRGSATSFVASALRRAIVTLELPPGTLIEKSEICDRLGLSRFPVSEALGRLQIEGLVDILPQRGTMVSRLRVADIREYMLIRTALECEAVHRLATDYPQSLGKELRAVVAKQKEAAAAGDQSEYHDLDLEFHELLFAALRFGRIKSIIDNARANVERARHLLNTPRRVQLTIEEHEHILDALEKGDAEGAASAMRTHIGNVLGDLFEMAKTQPTLFVDGDEELSAPD